ncbi:iron ABC transporter permease [Candidatus Bathyarchaeota archaeon]|nr:iron ABC transporter permease [Candidatus Bathyarchaeota archaeon]
MDKNSIYKTLDKLSSRKSMKYAVYLSSIIFFVAIILSPPILGILLKWNLIGQIFEEPTLLNRALNAIYASFGIAFLVSAVDVLTGLPFAWYITRGKAKILSVLDTLADMPFIVPTTALGYSLMLFWSSPGGISKLFNTSSLISPGWLLVILLHFVFSYPVVVRVLVGALMDYKMEYEEAARTLGAAPLTADRTVTLPIIKSSIIAAFTLAFARSISETGATMMVAGTFENGAIFIKNMKNAGYDGPMVFVSFVLIAISAAIFAVIRLLGARVRLPLRRVWPDAERKLSSKGITAFRNTVSIVIFFSLVIIPSIFVAFPAINAVFTNTLNDAFTGQRVWAGFWQSIGLSYAVGASATIINVVAGLPIAILIARKTLGRTTATVFDILTDIPIIIPSTALGASLSIFWKENFAFLPEIWPLLFAHLAITYPYYVKSMSAAIQRINIEYEEAARTLGARPFTVFRTIVFPLTKYSLFAGAIMVFTRSVSETGATLAVVTKLKTAPVLLVDWVKGNVAATSLDIGLGCGFLILFSFIILLALRLIVGGKGKY